MNAIPTDQLILLPVRNVVLFPGIVLPIAIGRGGSVAAAQEAVRAETPIGVILQRDPQVEVPDVGDLYAVGTIANILRFITAQDGSHHLVCQGVQRFRIVGIEQTTPYLVARHQLISDDQPATTAIEARAHQLRARAEEALQLLPQVPSELISAVQSINQPSMLVDMVASFIDLQPAERQEILETVDLEARFDKVLTLVGHRIDVMRLSREIGDKTREQMDQRQREYMLREQLKTIQDQLGEGDDERAGEIAELAKAIADAKMPEEAEKQAQKELKRLERMPDASGEYSMLRTYLDWLIELPWQKESAGSIDIGEARKMLDADHYGLEKVKRRILEFLAVQKLSAGGRSPILCFVGPPGVGKTSLGQSIARATGRRFVRASLGGVHDEAEIRGHRRTYIGALPGVIIQQLRKAGTRDCVFMLDEMDKLGSGFHGDPSSALLEVLDPEQNGSFRDNYLGLPFDLSHVMFIGTANVLDAIPGPLRDRMEVIELPGYTEDEKLEIARRYLVRRQLTANGLTPEMCSIDDEALRTIIRSYTREAGCRNLERQIGGVFRRIAVRIAEGEPGPIPIGPADVESMLGPARFENEVAERTSVAGVATGLAWTPAGGDILFIEATRIPGNGRLILTGQLGDVMKESAQAALSLVKSRAAQIGFAPDLFEKSDIHVHVPAGAIPKDGPSAGVAMFIALASLLADRPVRSDVAMTGEISLRGLVLPVGGIKEKVVAAARAGIRTVLLPMRNKKDLEDVPAGARDALSFRFLERVDEAMTAALAEEIASSSVPSGTVSAASETA
ncbi:MAG: endopeptidase La [Rhodospirillales bacterium]